jgi:hypothetical protein
LAVRLPKAELPEIQPNHNRTYKDQDADYCLKWA